MYEGMEEEGDKGCGGKSVPDVPGVPLSLLSVGLTRGS